MPAAGAVVLHQFPGQITGRHLATAQVPHREDELTLDDAGRNRPGDFLQPNAEVRDVHQDVRVFLGQLSQEYSRDILLAEMTGSALLTRYVSEVSSRSGLILALYGRPHSSECAVSEHRAVIKALVKGDTAAAIDVMDRHLEAVADRALIQTTTQKRRELRDVLDAYVSVAQAGKPPASTRPKRANGRGSR